MIFKVHRFRLTIFMETIFNMNTLSTKRQITAKSFWLLSVILLFAHLSFAQTPFIQKVLGNNCVGGGQIFVLQGVSGCSSINWSATGGGVITSLGGPESIQVVWSSTQTSASVTATYSYCSTGGSGSKNLSSIQIYDGVTPTISLPTNGNYDVCNSGGNVSFSATSSDEGSSPSYSWYVNNSFSKSTSGNSTSINVAPGDQVKVTLYSNAPCANPASVTSNIITIQQKDVSLPSNAFVADASYCGSETGAQVVVQNASAGYQHKIYRAGGSLLATAYPTSGMIFFGPYTAGTYNVYAVNDCNDEVLIGSSTISYNENPEGGTATPSPGLSQPFCDANPGTLSITAGDGSNYKWYIDNSSSPYSTSKTLTYPFNHEQFGIPGSHTARVTYDINNACGTPVNVEVSGMPVNIDYGFRPDVALSISKTSDICPGDQVTIDAIPSDAGSSPDFNWTIDGVNFTSKSFLYTVNHDVNVNLTMQTNESCVWGSSSVNKSTTLTVRDISIPNLGTVSNAIYCEGTTGADIVVQGGTPDFTYKLYNSSDQYLAQVDAGGNNMAIFTDYTEGTYKVYVVNPCGDEVFVGSSTITYNPNPSGGTATPSPDLSQSFCDGNPGTLTITAGSGSNYKWYIDNNSTPYSTSKTLTYPFNHEIYGIPGPHTVRVAYDVNNTCGVPVNVQVIGMPVNIDYAYSPSVSTNSLPPEVCPGTTMNLSATPSDAGTNPDYLWTIGTETFTSQSFDYTVNEDVNINLQLTSHESCLASSAVVNESTSIAVFTQPTGGELYGPSNYCPEAGGAQMVIQNTQDGYKYFLYRDGALVDEAVNDGGAAYFSLQSEIGTYSAKGANANCEGDKVDLLNEVQLGLPIAEPSVSIEMLPQQTATYCSYETITFRALIDGSDIVGGSNYTWNITGKAQISSASNSTTIDLSEYAPGDYSMTMSFDYNYGCGVKTINPGFSTPFTVNEPVPVSVNISTTEQLPVCKGIPVRYDAVISPSEQALNFNYQWKVGGQSVGGNESYYSSIEFSMHDKISCEISLKSGYTITDLCISDITPVSNIEDVLIHSIPAAPSLGGF
jgi:hypothetical protein